MSSWGSVEVEGNAFACRCRTPYIPCWESFAPCTCTCSRVASRSKDALSKGANLDVVRLQHACVGRISIPVPVHGTGPQSDRARLIGIREGTGPACMLRISICTPYKYILINLRSCLIVWGWLCSAACIHATHPATLARLFPSRIDEAWRSPFRDGTGRKSTTYGSGSTHHMQTGLS